MENIIGKSNFLQLIDQENKTRIINISRIEEISYDVVYTDEQIKIEDKLVNVPYWMNVKITMFSGEVIFPDIDNKQFYSKLKQMTNLEPIYKSRLNKNI